MSSWTFTVGPVPSSGLAAALVEALILFGGCEREQAEAACRAVLDVVASGTVGPSGVRVVVSGMASPGHAGLVGGAPSDPYVLFSVAHVPMSEPDPVPAVVAPDPVAPAVAVAMPELESEPVPFVGPLLGVPTAPAPALESPVVVPGPAVPVEPVVSQPVDVPVHPVTLVVGQDEVFGVHTAA